MLVLHTVKKHKRLAVNKEEGGNALIKKKNFDSHEHRTIKIK